MISRLNNSNYGRWITFLSTRVHESFINGDSSQNLIYSRWIEDVEHALKSALTRNLKPREAQDRLGDWLEACC